MFRAKEHGEADDAEKGDADVAETALARAIGNGADENSHDGGSGVGRDGQELSFGGGVAEVCDYGREEEGESVERAFISEGIELAEGLPRRFFFWERIKGDLQSAPM